MLIKRLVIFALISILMIVVISQDTFFWGHSGILLLLLPFLPGFTLGILIPLGDNPIIYFGIPLIINVIYHEIVYRLIKNYKNNN